MGNIFSSFRCHTLCLYSTLVAFSVSTVPGIHAFGPTPIQVGLQDMTFGLRIEKLIEKINRYKDKLDQKKMLETMIDIKNEVEGYTGKTINIDKELDKIESEIKKGGGKLQKDDFKKVRKIIKHADNRNTHKAMYMTDCMSYGVEYNAETELLNYMAKHTHEKEDTEEIQVPLRITVGVTIALCGFFLMFVPIPICQTNGPWIAQAGLALAIDGTITRVEENNKSKNP